MEFEWRHIIDLLLSDDARNATMMILILISTVITARIVNVFINRNVLRATTCFLLVVISTQVHGAAENCGKEGVWLQVLGSGGPEMNDKRASSSYLVWLDGHARVMLDTGGGSMLNFERSGANFNDLRTILYTHFHADHSAELPAYVLASYFGNRQNDLPVYGPSFNTDYPDTDQFVHALIAFPDGAFKYLNDFLNSGSQDGYQIIPHVIDASEHVEQSAYADTSLGTSAIPVHHGPVPAVAWRVEIGNKVIVISGDMNGDYQTLPVLAKGADILVADNAVPEGAIGVARNLHTPPSVIGDIASQAKVKQLVLSHRMLRTLGQENKRESFRYIRKSYNGSVQFANDMDCFRP